MNKQLQMFLVSLVSLTIGLSTGILLQGNGTENVIESSYTPTEQQPSKTTVNDEASNDEQLYQKAALITVKVLSGQTSGSGIIIQKQGNIYTVVTNHHVLIFGNSNQSYKIQTPDHKIHEAQISNRINFNNYDLGLLQFNSSENYQVASLSRLSKIVPEEDVFAAGFPSESNPSQPELVLSTGKVQIFSDVPFGGGYQIGYTNKVQKGMSGGPLFNRRGEIIGINGVHRYPLWGNPYVFQDGSFASPEKKQLMSQYSWAIPIQTFLNFAPNFAINKN